MYTCGRHTSTQWTFLFWFLFFLFFLKKKKTIWMLTSRADVCVQTEPPTLPCPPFFTPPCYLSLPWDEDSVQKKTGWCKAKLLQPVLHLALSVVDITARTGNIKENVSGSGRERFLSRSPQTIKSSVLNSFCYFLATTTLSLLVSFP